MAETAHKLFVLPNRTYQAQVRSEIKKLAAGAGFSAKRFSEFEIIIAEITSNLVKHTLKGGEILVKILSGDHPGIEIISVDHGPGMEFINNMMEDGISTTKTLGQGLGAIRRLSHEFDAYSLKGWGTVLLSRLYNIPPPATKQLLQSGTIVVAKDGDAYSGDNFAVFRKGNIQHVVICDGLGHGEQASIAAICCLEAYNKVKDLAPAEQLRHIHAEARKTRGAVMYVAQIDCNNGIMHYCGVGNIAAKIISPGGKSKNCSSYNGIVGHSFPGTVHSYKVEWEKADILIMHSDGLNTRWDLQKYPGILRHDRILLATALYKDHCRKTDDTLVSVIG